MNHPLGLCLHCISLYLEQKAAASKQNGQEGFQLSADELEKNCNIAVTLAPTWNQLSLGGGNVVMGCCAVPTCPIHLVQQTPQQTGRTQSGLLVPGAMN